MEVHALVPAEVSTFLELLCDVALLLRRWRWTFALDERTKRRSEEGGSSSKLRVAQARVESKKTRGRGVEGLRLTMSRWKRSWEVVVELMAVMEERMDRREEEEGLEDG